MGYEELEVLISEQPANLAEIPVLILHSSDSGGHTRRADGDWGGGRRKESGIQKPSKENIGPDVQLA